MPLRDRLLYQRALNTRGQNKNSKLITATNMNFILLKTAKNILDYLSNLALHRNTAVTGRVVLHVSTLLLTGFIHLIA